METWAWRFFLSGFCCLPFSITLGQTLLIPALVLQTVSLARNRRLWRWPTTAWGGLLYLLVTLLAAGLQPELARGWDRLSGLRWLILLPVAATFVTDHRRRTAFLAALATGSVLLALLTLIANPWQAWNALRAEHATVSTFSEALIHEGGIIQAQLLMLGMLATLGLLALPVAEKKRWLLPTALAVQAFAFILHFKRGSWICFVPLLVVWIVFRTRGKRLWILLPALALGLATMAVVPPVRHRISHIRQELDARHGGRWTMWTQVLPGLVRDYPWGLGYRQLTNERMREYAPHVEPDRNHLHSNIAQTLSDSGWPGLGAYLLWMGGSLALALRRAWLARRSSEQESVLAATFLLMFVALLANGLVEFNFGTSVLKMTLLVILVCLETPAFSGIPPDHGSPFRRNTPFSVFRI